MDRINSFLNNLREELKDSTIAAALVNGDIDVPGWMAISEDVDHIKAWDKENGGSIQMGFITLWY